ncbi:Hypothetical predicted protein [Olea europaea subsp. europaea]|uniref:Uncharacterized protein n=1 Tax=Olea europaea subsp. europaea TaxID=158383 RepID=A0A8S0QE36_OLEEU|nr:Hypothetical predicted protein [Olea europaea subsp. europaea]
MELWNSSTVSCDPDAKFIRAASSSRILLDENPKVKLSRQEDCPSEVGLKSMTSLPNVMDSKTRSYGPYL